MTARECSGRVRVALSFTIQTLPFDVTQVVATVPITASRANRRGLELWCMVVLHEFACFYPKYMTATVHTPTNNTKQQHMRTLIQSARSVRKTGRRRVKNGGVGHPQTAAVGRTIPQASAADARGHYRRSRLPPLSGVRTRRGKWWFSVLWQNRRAVLASIDVMYSQASQKVQEVRYT